MLAILKLTGDWGTFKGEKGAKSTVKTAEPKAAFVMDEKKKPVLKPKSEKPAEKAAPVEEAPAEEAPVAEEAVEAPAAEAPAEEAPVEAAADDAEAEKA